MKILFVYPCLNVAGDYQTGIGYIIALLKTRGHEVKLFNLNEKKDISKLLKEVKVFKPAIIAFSSASMQFKWVSLIATMIKLRVKSKALIICGGIHPTVAPDCLLECGELDGIVRGEGEYPMVELAERLERKKDYLSLRNFYFRDGCRIIKNELRPPIDNLDMLPFPDRSGPAYIYPHSFIFSRGCPFNCSYCSSHILNKLYNGRYVRRRSPQRSVEEIEEAIASARVIKNIVFYDDIFCLDKEWLTRFLNLYKRRIKLKFSCNVAAGTADFQTFKLMKECGCYEIKIGLESGDERLRTEVLRKPISNARIARTFEDAHRAGLKIFTFNMIGLPFETPRSFMKTVMLNKKLKVDKPVLYVFNPYPGTVLREVCIKEGFIDKKNMGGLDFKEWFDTLLNMPNFKREEILEYARNFHRLICQ